MGGGNSSYSGILKEGWEVEWREQRGPEEGQLQRTGGPESPKADAVILGGGCCLVGGSGFRACFLASVSFPVKYQW